MLANFCLLWLLDAVGRDELKSGFRKAARWWTFLEEPGHAGRQL
jgi:hypothetical protein